MKKQQINRFSWIIASIVFILANAGCGNIPATVEQPTPSPVAATAAVPTTENTAASATASPQVPVSGSNALFHDDFTNPATGWPEDKFDNYFVGYHEPEYYHVEITGPNYKTTVFEPKKESFGDFTVDLQVLVASAKTAPEGDFRYGLAFRRSGDQYYAFTISPRAKKWFVLKSSPNELSVLKEGTVEDIHDADVDDSLRVDAKGSDFYFHINDQLVGQVTDSDYASGEIGFYVESFDSPHTHIHFDDLTIRDFEAPQPLDSGAAVLSEDDFTDPATGWPEKKFDNYFVGYHEPEYYHIEITGPNYKTTVFEPSKESLSDFTVELQVLVASAKTAPEGDFRYGLAFRRSGDQYYAFTISPRAKKWFVLKSSPNELEVLTEGTVENIHDADVDDSLRVDAQGPNFLFHINDQLVGQVTDSDYASGEIGFYVESFDSPHTHIHFDQLTIRNVDLTLTCTVSGGTLYVRSGPSKTYPQISLLADGDTVQALGISPNQWIKIKVEGSDEPGWVSYDDGFLSCTPTIDLFPVVTP
jgi:Bacterial SH3 domain